MASTMDDIKELRERTGAGVLDCKKALNEKNGNVEEAVEYLREKGMAEAAKKAGRVASEGKVNVLLDKAENEGIIVEVNSETDFVAKNDNFQNLVDDISEHLLQSNVKNANEALADSWYKDKSKEVNTVIKEAIANIGENINLRRMKRFKADKDEFLLDYIHMGGKIGVLVRFGGDLSEENKQIAKNISMQIAASSPEYIDRNDVPEDVIEKEKKIYREQMLNEGKPEHILDQIVEGKIDKFFNQICLLEQEYIRDTDITAGEYLDGSDLEVRDFVRYELGEGIEEEEEDFASEVMAEIEDN
ncbi:MAG: translation elongation factor Ts [Halanaerobiales bacterium]